MIPFPRLPSSERFQKAIIPRNARANNNVPVIREIMLDLLYLLESMWQETLHTYHEILPRTTRFKSETQTTKSWDKDCVTALKHPQYIHKGRDKCIRLLTDSKIARITSFTIAASITRSLRVIESIIPEVSISDVLYLFNVIHRGSIMQIRDLQGSLFLKYRF